MRPLLLLILAILGGVQSGAAWAQSVAPSPDFRCVPHVADDLQVWRQWMKVLGPDWMVEQRAAEARRIGDDPSVFRHLDRLYLALDDGRLTTLVDCSFGNGMYVYQYERYDDVGRFYIVGKGEYEDFSYVLVSKKDGLTSQAYSLPAWSQDQKHFAHGRCSAMNGPDTVSIVDVDQDLLRTEATFNLPCSLGSCMFKWEDSATLLATCAGEAGKPMPTLRVARKERTWSIVP